MTIPTGGIKATYQGETIGWYETASEAQEAIDARRKAEEEAEAEYERTARVRLGL